MTPLAGCVRLEVGPGNLHFHQLFHLQRKAPRSVPHIFASSNPQSPGAPARCLWGLALLEGETKSLRAGSVATGSYANDGFLLANPKLLALGRGWASRTGEAGPGSFKPPVKGSAGQCCVCWPKPSPRPACHCRGLCVCPWSIPPAPCVWLAWRPSWTFMGKSQRPGGLQSLGAEPLGLFRQAVQGFPPPKPGDLQWLSSDLGPWRVLVSWGLGHIGGPCRLGTQE